MGHLFTNSKSFNVTPLFVEIRLQRDRAFSLQDMNNRGWASVLQINVKCEAHYWLLQ